MLDSDSLEHPIELDLGLKNEGYRPSTRFFLALTAQLGTSSRLFQHHHRCFLKRTEFHRQHEEVYRSGRTFPYVRGHKVRCNLCHQENGLQ